MFFRMVYKSGPIFLPFCQESRVWQTDRRTDGRTEFSSLDRVCISCSAGKTAKTCNIQPLGTVQTSDQHSDVNKKNYSASGSEITLSNLTQVVMTITWGIVVRRLKTRTALVTIALERLVLSLTQGRSVGGAGGAEHPRAPGSAPVLKMARSTPC